MSNNSTKDGHDVPADTQDSAVGGIGTGPCEAEQDTELDGGLGWLLSKEHARSPTPMDTVTPVTVRECYSLETVDSIGAFTMGRVFVAASKGDKTELIGLLDYLRVKKKLLTSPEFTDQTNGKTALLKALLNLKGDQNDTIEVLLDIADKTGDLGNFVNASYTDVYYKGQSALHIAIERRSFEHVKLLVQKGADVQAKANGSFFQYRTRPASGFYFGELPLSLAACTNQLDVVSFLLDNPYKCADVTDTDSQGNTVLHALVTIADNKPETTAFITKMYDEILIQHAKHTKEGDFTLEAIENINGLTPMKLAAKMGKIGVLTHMLQREFKDEETRSLSRKFTEWVYGPIQSSLYDMSSIDTTEDKSVLEIIVYGTGIPNRHEMLQIEPLQSLLQEKWDLFAAKIFLMNFLSYMVYLSIFTAVALYRKEGHPPFPVENNPHDILRCTGEVFIILCAVYFFYKAIIDFKRKPPNPKSLYIDGFCDILFFVQATLLLVCVVLYFCGRREYVGPGVVSLALAWINVLHYLKGSKSMGMYAVMIQRMILGDIMNFLMVYVVFLIGFSAAVVALMEEPSSANNGTDARSRSLGPSFECKRPSYNNMAYTVLELFKFTIGMGDLEFTDQVQYKHVFYILLIFYIVLTYILLLNMLIAMMGSTVEKISNESENIWKLQRALTILDLERVLPRSLRNRLTSGVVKTLRVRGRQCRFFRVEEMNWNQFRSNLGIIDQEDPETNGTAKPSPKEDSVHKGSMWNFSLLRRIGTRSHRTQQGGVL